MYEFENSTSLRPSGAVQLVRVQDQVRVEHHLDLPPQLQHSLLFLQGQVLGLVLSHPVLCAYASLVFDNLFYNELFVKHLALVQTNINVKVAVPYVPISHHIPPLGLQLLSHHIDKLVPFRNIERDIVLVAEPLSIGGLSDALSDLPYTSILLLIGGQNRLALLWDECQKV